MAKSFKEIGKKAEALIEQGKEADKKVQSCQARVASSNSRVVAARRQLAAASETDSEGHPVGDVGRARAQLSMAENQLAASQRALSSARGDAERIRQQKNAHVQEIEKHNQVERSNLEKLRSLRSGAFGADSAALTEGMALRLNEAEDARVALLRSMGIEVTPDHVAIGSNGGTDSGWRGGGFATLDTAGQVQSYRGGGSEGLTSSGGFAAPVGGALSPIDGENKLHLFESQTPSIVQLGGDDESKGMLSITSDRNLSVINGISNDHNLSLNEKISSLKRLKKELIENEQYRINWQQIQSQREVAKTHEMTDQQRYQLGLSYIENIIDVHRYNLGERDVYDGEAMERNLAIIRANYLKVLSSDIQNGTITLYDMPDPDYDALANQIRADYARYPQRYVFTERQRAKIREGIRKGAVTEKDIRKIGENVREKYDKLFLEKHREFDEVRNEQFILAKELKNASTKEEKERIEYRRKLLVQRENDLFQKYNSTEMMKTILSQYRDIGPESSTDIQPYQRSVWDLGSAKVISAINIVRQYIPTDWVKKSNEKPISVKHVSRGYFLSGNSSDIVALSGGREHMKSCAFHEMGHRFESLYPEILMIEKQFYERRTNGEPLSWLGGAYDKSEVARFDHFISAYMGKDYGGKGYELLSMGMEGVFCETFNMSRDVEYEDLILGILAAI